jgi:hypothetical protein
MEGDDVMLRIKLVKIFGDILSVPRIPSESEDERLRWIRLIRGDVHTVERLPIARPDRHSFSAVRQWPRRRNGIDRKNELRLKFEHRRRAARDAQAASAASIAGVTRSTV